MNSLVCYKCVMGYAKHLHGVESKDRFLEWWNEGIFHCPFILGMNEAEVPKEPPHQCPMMLEQLTQEDDRKELTEKGRDISDRVKGFIMIATTPLGLRRGYFPQETSNVLPPEDKEIRTDENH